MSKLIQLSDDGGTNWYSLAGNSGELTRTSNSADDSTHGADFTSSQPTLIDWGVNANSFYKGFAGYAGKLYTNGTGTSATAEACTLVSGKTYQIDDTTKRIWDRSVAVVVYDNSVDHTSDVESIDYLFGKVTFDSGYSVTGPVTVDVDYFPRSAFGKARGFTLTQTSAMENITTFDEASTNGGYSVFFPQQLSGDLSFDSIYSATNGFDTLLANRTEIIIDINPDGNDKSIMRGYYKVQQDTQSGDVGATEAESVNFVLSVPSGPATPFAWEHAADTTLAQAVRIALTSWLNKTKIDVRYSLDSGTSGWTGECYVSDVSLTGATEDVYSFTVNLQGTGALSTF